MQETEIPTVSSEPEISEPDSHIMLKRWIALFIDSIILAFMLAWAARALGSAQLGPDTPFPGGLVNTGGIFYNVPNGSGGTVSWMIKLNPLWQIVIVFLYFSLQEFFFGATIGKFIMKLRVISQQSDMTYTTLTIKGALLRNLVRFIDASGTYFVGLICCGISSRRRRLGDIAARTLVVRQESVPYLGMPRRQVKIGLQIVILLLVAFALGCPLYSYFWQPPLVIQNDVTVQKLLPDKRIFHYTLGEKTWGTDEQGQQMVTYPIQYTTSSGSENRLQDCKGSVTLTWHWSDFSWTVFETDNGVCKNL